MASTRQERVRLLSKHAPVHLSLLASGGGHHPTGGRPAHLQTNVEAPLDESGALALGVTDITTRRAHAPVANDGGHAGASPSCASSATHCDESGLAVVGKLACAPSVSASDPLVAKPRQLPLGSGHVAATACALPRSLRWQHQAAPIEAVGGALVLSCGPFLRGSGPLMSGFEPGHERRLSAVPELVFKRSVRARNTKFGDHQVL